MVAHHEHLLLGPRSPWWLRLIWRLGHLALWPSRLHPADLVPVLVHFLQLAGVAAAILVGVVAVGVGVRRLSTGGPVASSLLGASAVRRFRVLLPESFERQGLEGLFRSVALLLRPVLLAARPSLSFTLTVVGERLAIELECGAEVASPVVAGLEAAIGGIAVEEIASADEDGTRRWVRCLLRPAGSRWLPLESKHRVDPARFVLAMLRGGSERERACVQVVFSPLSRRARRQGRGEPRRLRTGRRGGLLAGVGSFGLELANEGLDLVTPGSTPAPTRTTRPTYQPDGWTLKQAGAIEEKTAEPLLAVTIRLAVCGGARRQRRWRLLALVSSFGQFHALGALRAGRELFGRRRFERRLPARRPPLAVTAAEAAALLPLPTNLAETRLEIGEAPARRLRPAADAPQSGIRLGRAER